VAPDLILRHTSVGTPLGDLVVVATDAGVVATSMDDRDRLLEELSVALGGVPRRAGHELEPAAAEVRAYFGGSLRRFRTPVDLRLASTPFVRRVWVAARAIPFGQVRTYGDTAAAAGAPRAARAVGSAMRRCPIELFVPCHRVVPAGPGLGSYGGEPGRRAFLLRLEGSPV
jgi:methylated-DNA-[protein]-cysteine S-methyltransferase